VIAFGAPIPILRMISLEKAKEFYVGFLGFQIDWEARYHDNAPVFMRVSRAGLRLLSEHHGDGSPGIHISVPVTGIEELRAELVAKKYKYMNPSIEDTPWGTRDMAVIDPVGNYIIFTEDKPAAV
jgi:catechol 2,3-dioxygenase-like lactoylglutathione lyase family enzyme